MTGPAYDRVKRVVDVLLGATLLVLSLPVQLVVALLVRRDLGRPVLFRQSRAGRGGVPFEILKFRTMAPGPAEPDIAADVHRISRVGRALRASSLDELPTLLNVVRGDMSLVGPRPLLLRYLERYSPEQARRHEVRPGVTGLAQVMGRNDLPWERRFTLDVEYVDRRSPALDLRILARTVATVLSRRGVSAAGVATAEEFAGGVPRD